MTKKISAFGKFAKRVQQSQGPKATKIHSAVLHSAVIHSAVIHSAIAPLNSVVMP